MNMAPAPVIFKKEESFGEADEGSMKRKKTMGRQKIEIKRIENVDKRQVCFSKRKDGLFKKASDLAVLCGGHVAAIAFSPGGKPFCFGHPSVEALIDRFVGPTAPATGPTPVHPVLLEEVNREADLLAMALEAEAGRKKALDAAIGQGGVWTSDGVHGKSAQDLLAMCSALKKVQADVADRLHQEFMAKEAMMHYTAAATDTDVSGIYHYSGGAGTFMSDGEVSSHHQHQVVMDTKMMTTMGGASVDHALPLVPMTLPPPPLPLPPYTHCLDLNLGPGYDDDPVFGVDGFYGGNDMHAAFVINLSTA